MRRALAIGLIGSALTLLSARPASAQYAYFRWIQQLSGPGPFALHGVTVTFGCAQDPKAKSDQPPEGPAIYRYVFCDYAKNWTSIRHFYGVSAMWGEGKNNLEFPAGREKLDPATSSLYLAFGTLRLDPGLDVGASLGFTRFTATPDITLTRFMINPFVAVRPVGLFFRKDRKVLPTDSKAIRIADAVARAVELNLGLIILPQGFQLGDFGAIGGADFKGGPEFNGQYGLKIRIVY